MISPAYQGSFLFGLQLGQFVLICIPNSKTQQKAGKTPSVSDQRQSWAECHQHTNGVMLPSVPLLLTRQNVTSTGLSSLAFQTS